MIRNEPKKRGISITRNNDRSNFHQNRSLLHTPVAPQRIDSYNSGILSSQSVHHSVRSSSAPKTNITFTYQGISPQIQTNSIRVMRTPRNQFINHSSVITKYAPQITQSEERNYNLYKEREQGDVYEHYSHCKAQIQKKLFKERLEHDVSQYRAPSYHPYIEEKSNEHTIQLGLQKIQSELYPINSYQEIVNRRRTRLGIHRDVVSYRIEESYPVKSKKDMINQQNDDHEQDKIINTAIKNIKIKEQANKGKQKIQKNTIKKAENLKDMEKKLKQIIEICQKR